MAIHDIDCLKADLPEVFSEMPVPPQLDGDWLVVDVDSPQTTGSLPIDDALLIESSEDMDVPVFQEQPPWPSTDDTELPSLEGAVYGGCPRNRGGGGPYPPPDCFAFYLPFHYFYPDWWGVYITYEGVMSLGRFIRLASGGVLTPQQAHVAARLFLYGHEAFHHQVECFATRLEIVERTPQFRTSFETLYQRTVGTRNCLEEALANANGFNLAIESLKGAARSALSDALYTYILGNPPGYSRGVEFLRSQLKPGRNEFAEESHAECFRHRTRVSAGTWNTFAYAFRGIGQITSRTNYLIHRSSPLAARLPADLRPIRYRDLAAKLRSLAGCVPLKQGKGSHERWKNADGKTFTVPVHSRDIAPGTLRQIIKDAGLAMSLSEFLRAG